MAENGLMDLMKYLSIQGRPVGAGEFKPFWDNCSDEEKLEFKQTELTPLKLTV